MLKNNLKRGAPKGVDVRGVPRSLEWEMRFNFLIHDVSRLRRSAFDRSMKPLGITRSQWWVLAYLSREDGMTQSRLAEELDLGKVAIGGLIDRLQKSGLVRRVADPADRRINRVFLEPSSKRMIARLRSVEAQLNEEILEGVTERELEVAAATLATIKHNLLKYLVPPDQV
ncbi:DNA-binding transcriptional regulator, MarR family [Variovorax sp. HW608]|uniref:MarR family winged helix-turn-helix transcriptional regulator n=1 Tax=Variovorax sp. HW608 TaxID=1034889 RepID=UPI00081FCDE0|nr:MarR family transcriptional regulator [Variovorax sp. HW608]SCK10786.1 DNA-binding transcriptional regulator, MarR family [Variovorax sp. HW608]